MDFLKVLTMSFVDVGSVAYAKQLYNQADAIMESLEFSPKEAKIASDLISIRERAIRDYELIMSKYSFSKENEIIIIENSMAMHEELAKEGNEVIWKADFYGYSDDPTQRWSDKLKITANELFELYKVEYIYENMKDMIPGDYVKYHERYYALAGMFNSFVSKTKAM